MAHHEHTSHGPINAQLGALRGRLMTLFLGIAVAGAAAAIFQTVVEHDGTRRFMLAYVVAFCYVLSIALGGLFFVIIQHLTRAGWSVQVRRVPEAMAASLPLLAILFIPIAFTVLNGKGDVFPWARPLSAEVKHVEVAVPLIAAESGHGSDAAAEAKPVDKSISVEMSTAEGSKADAHTTESAGPAHGGESVHHKLEGHEAAEAELEHQHLDELTVGKRPWLDPTVFIIRWVVVLGIWAVMGTWYFRNSVSQDQDGDYRRTIRMETLSAPLIIVFAFSLSIAAWDLLMSVNPHWYSTIFSVYYFAGCFISGLAFTILWIVGLSSAGVLPKSITVDHRHDLGRLLFAFVIFWSYIAFSQYMLIWYANLPEFTLWFKMRGVSTAAGASNGWSYIALALLFGHFVIPFLGLLSRHVKRNPTLLCFWAVWMLVIDAIDLLWLVMPELGPELHIGAIEVGLIFALLGLFAATVTWVLSRQSLVPMQDPRLAESVAYESLY